MNTSVSVEFQTGNCHCRVGKDIEKACQGIYPLQNTCIRKVKVLRAPKFDITKVSSPGACNIADMATILIK